MYRIYDTGKPAYYPYKPDLGWVKCEFQTWEEARNYAESWLGKFGEDVNLLPNKRCYYVGGWDYIEIIQIRD